MNSTEKRISAARRVFTASVAAWHARFAVATRRGVDSRCEPPARRAARSTANGRASARSAPKRPRSGGRGDVVGRVATRIGALGPLAVDTAHRVQGVR